MNERHGQALSGRAWKRIAIVAGTVSVLMGGVTAFAAHTGASEARPSTHHDRLVRFEQMGCREIAVFPKHGWVCIARGSGGSNVSP